MESPKPPRGFTIGAGVELVGIAVGIFGVTSPYGTGGGGTVQGNPVLGLIGVIIALIGLALHTARI